MRLSIALLVLVAGAVMMAAPPDGVPAEPISPRRLLDFLPAGTRVEVSHADDRERDVSIRIIDDATIAAREVGAEEWREQIAVLEGQVEELTPQIEAVRQELETLVPTHIEGRFTAGEIYNFVKEQHERSVQRKEARRHFQELKTRRADWKRQIVILSAQLPGHYTTRIHATGDDYFSIENGRTITVYPLARLHQITRQTDAAAAE